MASYLQNPALEPSYRISILQLTNADMLNLKAQVFQIVPAPLANQFIRILRCDIQANLVTPYTGLDATGSQLAVYYQNGSNMPAAVPLVNDTTVTPNVTNLTKLLGA